MSNDAPKPGPFAIIAAMSEEEREALERANAKYAAERKAAGLPPLPSIDVHLARLAKIEAKPIVCSLAPRPVVAVRRVVQWLDDTHTLH